MWFAKENSVNSSPFFVVSFEQKEQDRVCSDGVSGVGLAAVVSSWSLLSAVKSESDEPESESDDSHVVRFRTLVCRCRAFHALHFLWWKLSDFSVKVTPRCVEVLPQPVHFTLPFTGEM